MGIKKVTAFLMAVLMVCGAAGCSDKTTQDSSVNETETDSSSVIAEQDVEQEVSSEAQETTAESEIMSEAEQTSESSAVSSEAGSDSKADENSGITAEAVQDTDTAEDKAAEINQWVSTTIYSPVDSVYHTIYVRVTKSVSRSDDEKYVNDAIELHNSLSSEYGQIDESQLKIPSDCELCVMEYEVYVPSDFPSSDYGIIAPDINFSVHNIGGGGIPSADGASTYIGMGSMTSLETEEEVSYQVGNTYSFRCLYMMVQGYKNYEFTYDSYAEGTSSDDISSDVSVKGYYKIS